MTEAQSTFSWLDYSEAERRRMNEVIGLFREQGILDELGIGSIRDAFADLFYPGTSTIQTRARYFLFLPWMYLAIEKDEVPSSQVFQRARDDQIKLIYALERGSDRSGIIGVEAREQLQRLPSSIYWSGLASYGIRRFRGSAEQYYRSLDAHYSRRRSAPRFEEGERFDLGLIGNWHDDIPTPPRRWTRSIDFALTFEEADYLRDRITSQHPDVLLTHLLNRGTDVGDIAMPWSDPDFAVIPHGIQNQLGHARNFSEVMLGATRLYHALLSEAAQLEDSLDSHLDGLRAWGELMEDRRSELSAWDRQGFWTEVRGINPRISFRTEEFVREWITLGIEEPSSVFGNARARRLITERERRLKVRLARLTNPAALETWSGTTSVTQLTYRWNPNAQQIVSDILEGLRTEETADDLEVVDA